MLGYLVDPQKQFMSKGGDILVGGHLEVYLVGTDDRAVTYSDFVGTLNPADITLDANGRAVVVADSDMSYRVEVYSASGALQWTVSPALVGGGSFVAVDGKADKVNDATEGHLASLTENGDIEDSGFGIDDIKNFPSYVILDRNASTTTFAKVKEIFNSGKIPLIKNNSDLYVPSSLSDSGSTFSCITSTELRGIIINNAGVFDSNRYFSPMRVLTIYSSLSSTNLFVQLKDLVDNTYVIVRLYQSSSSAYRYATLDSFQLNDDENDYVYFKFVESFVYNGSKVYGVTYKENEVIIDYGAETERTDFGAVISPSDIADEDVEHGSRTIVCEIKGMQFRCYYHTKQQTTSSQFVFEIVDKDYADDWSESPVTLYDMQSFIYYPFRSTNDTQAVRERWYDLVTQPDGARGGATLSFTCGVSSIPWYTYVGEPFDMEGWVKSVKGGHYMLFHYRIDGRYTAGKIGFKVTLIDEGAV
jgi:hypothetical protein